MTAVSAVIGALANLAWPILVATLLIYFRKELKQAFNRITHIGPSGVDILPPPQTAQSAIPAPAHSAIEDSPRLLLPAASHSIALFEISIRNDLQTQPANATDKENLLVRTLAGTQLELAFERIYSQIFGSQLKLIQELNVAPVNVGRAREHYDLAAALWPSFYATYAFEPWLSFIYLCSLAEADGQLIRATPAVPEFLGYIAARHLTLEKYG